MGAAPKEALVRGVKSAQRVLELLEFFSQWQKPATVKEVCTTLGYPQSSTSMLLRSLCDLGYFDHDPRSGMYVPNIRLALATAWIEADLFSGAGMLRLMTRVRDACGHTVMMGKVEGVHVRHMHVLQGTRKDSAVADLGSRRPLFRSAAGRILLTTVPEKDIALLLRKANALESDPQLRVRLTDALAERAKTKRRGFSLSPGTSMPGIAALAVLVPVPVGRPAISLSVGGPLKAIQAEQHGLHRILEAELEPLRAAARPDRTEP